MLITLALLPIILAFLVPLAAKVFKDKIGWAVLPIPVIVFISYLSQLGNVAGGDVFYNTVSWVEHLGVNLSFRLDGLSLLFALIISGIGSLVVFYSIFYLSKRERLTNFYVFLMLFMGAMLGVVTSNNLIMLYLFWELTSMSSFLLIGFWYEKKKSVEGARKALLLTVSGGFALLIAFILIGNVVGSFELNEIFANMNLIRESSLLPAIILLLLFGAFTKSAQIPCHIWLPTAMEAPTPISAYLHSATMVKAGIYLLARFSPVFVGIPLWNGTIAIVGVLSLLFGSFMALRQTDLKGVLAYSTISQLGLIICLVGIGTPGAVFAGMFHLINHSAFKGSLFLMTGIVDHETGTREMPKLRGLARVMPITAIVALIGSFSMAGLPPFSGFLSKEMFLDFATQAPVAGLEFLGGFAYLIPVIGVIASIFTFTYSFSIFGKVFLGKEVTKDTPKQPHEGTWGMLAPALILVSLNIIIAIMPNLFGKNLIAPATLAVSGVIPETHIAFWHGINLPLIFTLIIITVGALIYWKLDSFKAFIMKYKCKIGSEKFYQWTLEALPHYGGKFTDWYMTGKLGSYTGLTALISFILIASPIFVYKLWEYLSFENLAPISVVDVILCGVIVVAAICVAKFKNRLWAILALSSIGYCVSLFFVILGAPDLALTQLLVETISLVLYLLVLKELPAGMGCPTNPKPKRRTKYVNMAISIFSGAVVTFTMLFGYANNWFESISQYYIENSKLLAGGNNIVNVILVDFRGLDTMGEITVLGLAAIGVFVLINLNSRKANKKLSLRKGGNKNE